MTSPKYSTSVMRVFAVAAALVVSLFGTAVLLLACRNPLLQPKPEAVSPPTFSPAGGVFGTDQLVALGSATDGATIYYTTDGSTPTSASTVYSGPIAVAGNGTNELIKAIALKSGMRSSAVVETSFVIDYSIGATATLASPGFSPTTGVYPSAPTVRLSGPSGASIYYTTDGSNPSASHGNRYAGPFALSADNGATVTVRAISTQPGMISSPIVSASYKIDYSQVGTPQISPAGGMYTEDLDGVGGHAGPITITVPGAPAGTAVYFTFTSGSTTGVAPATSVGGSTQQYSVDGTVVTPVPVVAGDNAVVTVQAIAACAGHTTSTIASATYTISYAQLASPTFAPAGGTYSSDLDGTSGHPGPVALSCATADAVIYYTIDGSAPAGSVGGSTKLFDAGSPIVIAGDGTVTTVNAIAAKAGMKSSTVASATYAISYGGTTLAPQLDRAGGSYPYDLSGTKGVCIACATGGALIYYTTDGSTPTTSSAVFTPGASAPIAVSGDGATKTITAIAKAAGLKVSPVTQATYAIHYPMPAPAFSVAGGSYTSDIDGVGGHPGPVVISDANASADIYYTTNGSAPSVPASGATMVIAHGTTGSVAITGDGTVKTVNAVAVDYTGVKPNSSVTSATYTISYPQLASPTFAPAGGTYSSDLDGTSGHPGPVVLSCGTSGASIYYTTDGSTPSYPPSGSTTLYSAGAPIVVSGDGTVRTIRAIAAKAGVKTSTVASATYAISYGGTTLAPQLSVAGGSYATDLDGAGGHAGPISIACATGGALIYYTTDGSTPTTSSAVFTPGASAPIAVSGDGATKTITAIAKAAGLKVSPVTQATYAIHYPMPAPAFSVAGGSYTSDIDGVGGHPGPVVISDANASADIYYTTNGSAPSVPASGATMVIAHGTTGSVAITGDGTVKTVNAVAVDYTGVKPNSSVTSATYTISYGSVASPSFLPTPQVNPFGADQTVSLSCATSGALIYYTTDGSTPSYPPGGSTTQYVGSISVAGDGTVKTIRAIGAKAGLKTSAVASAIYSISYPTVATPSFTPTPQADPFNADQTVSLSCGTAGAAIYYTIDGSTPTIPPAGTTIDYGTSGPIAVRGDGTVKTIRAIAAKSGMKTSAMVSATYTISYGGATAPPSFSVAGGNYPTDLDGVGGHPGPITISCATGGAVIYVTIDGTTPTVPPTGTTGLYSAAISVAGDGATKRVTAIAVAPGLKVSPVMQATYTIHYPLPAPSFSLPSNTYAGDLDGVAPHEGPVMISDANANADIYFTTNGSAPVVPASGGTTKITHGTSGSVVIAGDRSVTTINAVAVDSTGVKPNSAAASATYVISYPQASAPSFAPPVGTYFYDLSGANAVTLSCATGGASIYYTIDNSTPTIPPAGTTTPYSAPITVAGDGTVRTIRAVAGGTGFRMSTVAAATYTISYGSTTLAPTFSVAGGSYPTDLDGVGGHPGPISISCGTGGASIYYTTDGSTPTVPPTGTTAPYSAPIAVSDDGTVITITAVAKAAGLKLSPVAQARYVIHYPLPAPSFSLGGAIYPSDLDGIGGHAGPVQISDVNADADIYYTTNGSAPTPSSTKITHGTSGTVAVTGDGTVTTINAVAVDSTGVRPNSSVTSATYSIVYPQLNVPGFTVPGGGYTTDQSVSLTRPDPSATIYYTTNGTVPTTASAVFTPGVSAPITVAGDGAHVTVMAFATAPGMRPSAVASATYTVSYPQAASPSFSLAGGTYTADQSVSLSHADPSATIYYTTDGSAPTTGSAVFVPGTTAPIEVDGDGTSVRINTLATRPGMRASAIASATYTIGYPQLGAPGFSTAGGSYASDLLVSLTRPAPSATIYYTTDGTVPTISSAEFIPGTTAPIAVAGDGTHVTVMCFATAPGMHASVVASATCTVSYMQLATPSFSTAGGTYTADQSVSLSHVDPTVTIRYTIDGSLPTTASPVFIPGTTAPIAVSGDGTTRTIRALASKSGTRSSDIASASYFINYTQVAAPSFSQSAGSYFYDLSGANAVAISCTTIGASIYYTLDGTDPLDHVAGSTQLYGAPIAVVGDGTTRTIRAMAVMSGMRDSPIASATYLIAYPQVATPVLSPTASTYPYDLSGANAVTLSCATAGVSMFFTIDGSTPSSGSNPYPGFISIVGDGTIRMIRVIATKPGMRDSQIGQAVYTIHYPIAAPSFSEVGGAYSVDLSVVISDTDTNARVYYTTDGTTPTTASTSIAPGNSATVTIAGDGTSRTLKAFAVDSTSVRPQSGVTSATYFVSYNQVAAPYFSLPGGVIYPTDLTIGMGSTTPGATLYYTVDGSTPTYPPTGSTTPFGALVSINGDGTVCTVRALAHVAGMKDSPVSSATYYVNYAQVATPTFSPGGGVYDYDLTTADGISLSTTTGGASIYYTTDGTTPTYPPTGTTALCTGTVGISGDGTARTLRALAVKSGMRTSTVASASYLISYAPAATPSFTPAAGSYEYDLSGANAVTITCTTPDTQIYYTTDGTTPTYPASGTTAAYSVPITVSGDGTVRTIRAIAAPLYGGMRTSAVEGATYAIDYRLPAAIPTITPSPAGTAVATSYPGGITAYSADVTVTLASTTPGATIYYTSDGSAPTYPPSGSTASCASGGTVVFSHYGATKIVRAIAKSAATKPSSEATPQMFCFWAERGISQSPRDIALDAMGRIFVSTYSTVMRMDDITGTGLVQGPTLPVQYAMLGVSPSGTPIYVGGVNAGGVLETVDVTAGPSATNSSFSSVWGLALDQLGRIYVSTGSSIVRMDDITGANSVPRSVGGMYPMGTHVDTSGHIFVNGGNSIYEFKDITDPAPVSLGGFGQGRGIAVDAVGRIYATDLNTYAITRMDNIGGTNRFTVGSSGSGVGQFTEPDSIAVDPNGIVYVTDWYTNRVIRLTLPP